LKHNKPGEEEVVITQERKLFDMPELLHNLDLLVDMSESAVLQNDKK
jgi:tuftelin-interacting protein 11